MHASKKYMFAAVDMDQVYELSCITLIAPVDAHAHPPRIPTTASPAHHRIA
jgi:hypothetical protein